MSNLGSLALPPLPRQEIDEVVIDLEGLWRELRGAQIFFTGATGFFGVWLLETLLAADERYALGIEAAVLSRNPNTFARKYPRLASHSKLRWVQGSVTTLEATGVAGALGQTRSQWDVLIHLATESDNAATLLEPRRATQVIADGTQCVLDFAVTTGVRRMLFTSSGSVCAKIAAPGELLSEDHVAVSVPLDSATAYGISGAAKRTAEAMCTTVSQESGLAVSIARCFTFAGPGMPLDGKFAFGNFLRDALANRPIIIQGDGTPVRSYLYAADLARWLWTILLRGAPGRIYNVGSEAEVSMRVLAETVARETAAGVNVQVLGKRNTAAATDFYVPSTARARQELGLSERTKLSDAIRQTAAWLGRIEQH